MRRFGLRARAALLLCLLSSPASAHAILVDSAPAANAEVASGPATLELRFNSRIDRLRSRLSLAYADGKTVVLKLAESPPDILRAEAPLTPGPAMIRWQVLAVDGHITRGEVPFRVAPAR